jgi:hypothetical protein
VPLSPRSTDAGTLLTHLVIDTLERRRVEILYASGSGVYGELGEISPRRHGPLIPVSIWQQTAGEALLSSYCYMFGCSAVPSDSGTSSGHTRPTVSVSTSSVGSRRPHVSAILGMGSRASRISTPVM